MAWNLEDALTLLSFLPPAPECPDHRDSSSKFAVLGTRGKASRSLPPVPHSSTPNCLAFTGLVRQALELRAEIREAKMTG